MTKSRDQALFDALYTVGTDLGYKVYPYKPSGDTKFPYMELEGTQTINVSNKTAIHGSVIVMVSIWGEQIQRGQVSSMASAFFNACLSIQKAGDYHFSLDANASGIQIIQHKEDVSSPVLHRAIMSIQFSIL